jgi:hypothetical protein
VKIRTLAVAISLLLAHGAGAATLSPVLAKAVTPDQLSDAIAQDASHLLLRGGVIDPLHQRLDYRASGAAADVDVARYAVVQFNANTKAARQSLEQGGLRVVGYIPNNAYVVELKSDRSLDALSRLAGARWTGYYQPGMKLDPALWTHARTRLREAELGGYDIDVFGFPGESAQRLAAAVSKTAGVQVLLVNERADAPQIRVHVEAPDLAALAHDASAEDGVSWVLPHYAETVSNSGGPPSIQGNQTSGICTGSLAALCGPTPFWDHNLYGSGQVVSISDSGLDANEAWFTTLDKGAGPHTEITVADSPVLPAVGAEHPLNKIFAYWVQPGANAYDNNARCTPSSSLNSYHGTHTSGTIVGDAAGTFGINTYTASTPTTSGHDGADGMAPNAQLLFQDIGTTGGCLSITDLPGTLHQAYDGGARIHSASWGGDDAGAYASDDFLVDNALWNREDLIFVVAAGNSGSAGAMSVGSPANAKNAISVGALGHAPSTTVVGFSSRGPTADGRIKPDVMAQGNSIVSAGGDSSTTATIEAPATATLSGTSMATPTIAGNAALVRQYFVDGFYPRGSKTAADTYNPSGMAMKAVLLNGTNPISATAFGGFDYGWGRAWLDGNLWFATTNTGGDDTRRLRLFERTNIAGLKTGEVHEYTIANVAAGKELRATLTWYDPEAQPGSALTLVNNLDLEVVAPDGTTTYLGNHFTSGVSSTGGSADIRNSVEQVRLNAPLTGQYTFRVKGTNIPGGNRAQTDRQGYALAVSGAFGLPDTTPFAAPTLGAATTVGNTVEVAFAAAGGAQGFQLYRTAGTCATANAGDFRLVGAGLASPLVDTTAQGGTAYAYRVRGIANDVEGAISDCVDYVAATACTLQPNLDPTSLAVTGTTGTTCHVDLGWQPTQPSCPLADPAVTYKVQRATDPYFTSSSTVASAVSGATFSDIGVVENQPYFYKINSADSLGNTSPYSHVVGGTPIGPNGVDGATYYDDADTRNYMTAQSPWQVTNTKKSNGTYAYHSAGDGVTYPANSCYALTTPVLHVQPGAVLNFKANYDLEYQFDGMVMELSTNGGATWTDLPPTGGYPSTFSQTGSPASDVCGYAATHGAFNGVSTTTSNADPNNGSATAVFKPFTANLAAYANKAIQIRWVISTDSGAEFNGAFLDEINLGPNTEGLFQSDFETPIVYGCSSAP